MVKSFLSPSFNMNFVMLIILVLMPASSIQQTNKSSAQRTNVSSTCSEDSAFLSARPTLEFLQKYISVNEFSRVVLVVSGHCYDDFLRRIFLLGFYTSVVPWGREDSYLDDYRLAAGDEPWNKSCLFVQLFSSTLVHPAMHPELPWLVLGTSFPASVQEIRLPVNNQVVFAIFKEHLPSTTTSVFTDITEDLPDRARRAVDGVQRDAEAASAAGRVRGDSAERDQGVDSRRTQKRGNKGDARSGEKYENEFVKKKRRVRNTGEILGDTADAFGGENPAPGENILRKLEQEEAGNLREGEAGTSSGVFSVTKEAPPFALKQDDKLNVGSFDSDGTNGGIKSHPLKLRAIKEIDGSGCTQGKTIKETRERNVQIVETLVTASGTEWSAASEVGSDVTSETRTDAASGIESHTASGIVGGAASGIVSDAASGSGSDAVSRIVSDAASGSGSDAASRIVSDAARRTRSVAASGMSIDVERKAESNARKSKAMEKTLETEENYTGFTVELWESYTVTNETPVAKKRILQWTPSAPLPQISDNLSERRMDLLGAKLTCITEQQAPGVYVEDGAGGQWIIFGWVVDLVRALQGTMNFTCLLVRPPDREFGALSEEGVWSGMVGEVSSGRADIIVASLDNTLARSDAVDFLISIDVTGFIMVTRPTDQMGSAWTNYTSEFSGGVWGCLVALVGLGCVVIYATRSRSPCERRTDVSFAEACTTAIAAIASQSYDMATTATSARTAWVTLLLTAVVVSAHYNCWLYSTLTVIAPGYPFDGFQSLLNKKTYTLGIVKGLSIETELKESKDKMIQRVWNELVSPRGLLSNVQEGLRKAREEGFVFLIIESEFYGSDINPCDYTVLPRNFFKFPSGFAVKKGSPLGPIFNKALIQAMNTGVLRRTIEKWSKQRTDCSAVTIGAFTLKQTVSAFCLLAAGCATALLVCSSEIIWKWKFNPRNNRRRGFLQ